jgi:hypothetical protein
MEAISSIHNLRAHHDMVTRDPLNENHKYSPSILAEIHIRNPLNVAPNHYTVTLSTA